MRRHYQRLLEMLLPRYTRQPVQVPPSQTEGAIEPWAQTAFFNFTGLAALPASVTIDGYRYTLSASSGPVLQVPVRDCRGWEIDWGTATPAQFQILYTSDVRDRVAGL